MPRRRRNRGYGGDSFDIYLKFDKIKGPVTEAGFEGSIKVWSFSWGASAPVGAQFDDEENQAQADQNRLQINRPSFSSFNIMKQQDIATPYLYSYLATRRPLKKATITLVNPEGKPLTQYTFLDVALESVQESGSSGGDTRPTESASIFFGSFEMILYNYTRKPAKLVEEPPIDFDGASEALTESPFAKFSSDLLITLFCHLEQTEMEAVSLTCKAFYKAASSDKLFASDTTTFFHNWRTHETILEKKSIPDYNGHFSAEEAAVTEAKRKKEEEEKKKKEKEDEAKELNGENNDKEKPKTEEK